MNTIKYAMSIMFIFCVSQFMCSNDPDILLTPSETVGVISGVVIPSNAVVTIDLYRGSELITTTFSENGSFSIKNVPYGSYTIVATYNDRKIVTNVLLYESFQFIDVLDFSTLFPFLKACSYTDGCTLTLSNTNFAEGDSISFVFRLLQDYIFDTSANIGLQVYPEKISSFSKLVIDQNYSSISVPVDSLITLDSISFYLKVINIFSPNLNFSDSGTITYHIDTTGLDSAITMNFIHSISPKNGAEDVSTEGVFTIEFIKGMNWKSVEENTYLTPSCSLTFFWNAENSLLVEPSNCLSPSTQYILTLGKNVMTHDSVSFLCGLNFTFKTGNVSFFKGLWPLNGNTNVDIDIPFKFQSNFIYDPLALEKSFLISPRPDSLQFIAEDDFLIKVFHSPLLADTVYTITIDSTLSSLKGTLLGEDMIISFRTSARD